MNHSHKQTPDEGIIEMRNIPYIKHISHMRCGAYTSEWVATAMGLTIVGSNEQNNPTWQDYLRPMLPLTIIEMLKELGLESYSYSLADFTDEQKLIWIKEQIVTQKKPLLVLIKTTTLHWIVIAGYSDSNQEFYVYDPNFGETSKNNDVPVGNKQLDYRRLLIDWEGSYIFKYIAVIISTDRLKDVTTVYKDSKDVEPDISKKRTLEIEDSKVENNVDVYEPLDLNASINPNHRIIP
jgi:hypothetical protein